MDARQITLSISVALSLLSFMPAVDKFVKLLPELIGSLFSNSVAIRVEDKCRMSRARNQLFILSILPLCILFQVSGIYAPHWISTLEAPFDLLSVCGVFLAYCLLRTLMRRALPVPRIRSLAYASFCGLPKTFAILLLALLFPAVLVLDLAGCPEDVAKYVICGLVVFLYAVFLIRRFKIFASEGFFLQAISYLCALEIVPTTLLTVSAVVF